MQSRCSTATLTALAILMSSHMSSPALAGVEEFMSFQARLTDTAGNPRSDGEHTLDFFIYDAETGGAIIGAVLNTVVIIDGGNGVVSTAIGPMNKGWFEQAPRFIGLTIDDDDDDPAGTELSPRIRMTSVPFAFRAFNLQSNAIIDVQGGSFAGSVSVGGAIGIGTATPAEQLHLRSVSNNAILLESTGAMTTPAYVIRNSAREWQMRVLGSDHDIFDIRDATASASRLSISSDGFVGLGITQPGAHLHVADWGVTSQIVASRTDPFVSGEREVAYFGGWGAKSDGALDDLTAVITHQTGSDTADLGFWTSASGQGRSRRMTISSGGKVGIGTASPATTLDVSHTNATPISDTTFWNLSYGGGLFLENGVSAANAVTGIGLGGGANTHSLAGIGMVQEVPNSLGALALYTGGAGRGNTVPERLRVDSAGRVGIGTTTPQTRLQVAESGGFAGIVSGRTDPYVSGQREVAYFGGWGAQSNGSMDDLTAIVTHQTGSETADLGFWTSASGQGRSRRMTISSVGKIGIGTAVPSMPLDLSSLNATPSSSTTFWNLSYGGGLLLQNNVSALNAVTGINLVGGANNNAIAALGMVQEVPNSLGGLAFYTGGAGQGSTVPERLRIDSAGNIGIGTSAPQAKLDVTGTIRGKVLVLTGGADLAEPFVVDPGTSGIRPEPGMVVVIDSAHPGALMLAASAYDRKVAGIISGANGLDPALILKSEGSADGDGEHPVALSGRVWCRCDASTGSIAPGDRLTTSGTPGHAMRVADEERAVGSVIGKAMTPLRNGTGLVLILVTLQ